MYVLRIKSVIVIDKIDGVKYSFRRSAFLSIAKSTKKFKTAPLILINVTKTPKIFDSVSEYIKLGSVDSISGDVAVGSTFIQHVSKYSEVLRDTS